jgi:hypothetical protein
MAQNRGEAPSPSGASRPSTSPRAAGRGEKAQSFSRRIRARVLLHHAKKIRASPGRRSAERRIVLPIAARRRQACAVCATHPLARLRILIRCARLPALRRGTRQAERIQPWLSPRTGFPNVSGSRVFCPLPSSRRLSALRADRSLCRSTGAPGPPGSGSHSSARGDRTRSA